MATYGIYDYNNGEIGDPYLTVVLSDDDAEIVDIVTDDPSLKEEAEASLTHYIDYGFSPTAALTQFAGTYGSVRKVDTESTQ